MNENNSEEKIIQFRKEMDHLIKELQMAYQTISELKKENQELRKRLSMDQGGG